MCVCVCVCECGCVCVCVSVSVLSEYIINCYIMCSCIVCDPSCTPFKKLYYLFLLQADEFLFQFLHEDDFMLHVNGGT